MRVLDLILRADTKDDEAATAFKSIAGEAVALDAQNVAEWYDAHVPRIPEDKRLDAFDRCVPPFRVTIVEFRWVDLDVPHNTLGVQVWRRENDRGEGWLVEAAVWFSDRQKLLALYPVMLSVPVSHDGAPDFDNFLTFNLEKPKERVEDEQQIINAFFIALLAFRFANARNARLVEHPAPRHERRRAEKDGEPAPVTYRTLEIGPITKRMETEGRLAEVGLAKAFHLCRGHFADYTQGAGLFGKYKVEVFVPEHFKGRKSRGVVEKDYRVIAAPSN